MREINDVKYKKQLLTSQPLQTVLFMFCCWQLSISFVALTLLGRRLCMYVCMYVSFRQGSSLLWTHTLRPFIAGPLH